MNRTSEDSVDASAFSPGFFEFLRTYAAQMTVATRWITVGIKVARYLGLSKLANSVDLLLDAFLVDAAEQ